MSCMRIHIHLHGYARARVQTHTHTKKTHTHIYTYTDIFLIFPFEEKVKLTILSIRKKEHTRPYLGSNNGERQIQNTMHRR